jgi:hypothetical protein
MTSQHGISKMPWAKIRWHGMDREQTLQVKINNREQVNNKMRSWEPTSTSTRTCAGSNNSTIRLFD